MLPEVLGRLRADEQSALEALRQDAPKRQDSVTSIKTVATVGVDSGEILMSMFIFSWPLTFCHRGLRGPGGWCFYGWGIGIFSFAVDIGRA